MKKTRIISAIMALTIIATPTLGNITRNSTKSPSYQLTAYAATKQGWIKEYGKWYYYISGKKQKNMWIANKYYVGSNGAMVIGWKKIDKKWYYFGTNPDGGAKWCDAWVLDGGYWYYLGPDGRMYENQAVLYKRELYYLGSDGKMVTNKYVKIGNVWWYFDPLGVGTKQ